MYYKQFEVYLSQTENGIYYGIPVRLYGDHNFTDSLKPKL